MAESGARDNGESQEEEVPQNRNSENRRNFTASYGGYSNPLTLLASDHLGMTIISSQLTELNYISWSHAMRRALSAKNRLGFINGTLRMPKAKDVDYDQWLRVNDTVVSWILNSISSSLVDGYSLANKTFDLWEELKERYGTSNGPQIYQLQGEINTIAQGNLDLAAYYTKLKRLWDELANEGGGEAPLEGSIPDMTSSTELYVNLQKIYQAKAEADIHIMEQHVKNILKKIGKDQNSISKATIKSFCKNARKIKVCRYRSMEDEYMSPSVTELQKYLTDEEYSIAAGFYILLRAADRFYCNYNSFPGQYDGAMDEEISRLKTTAVSLLNDLGCNSSPLTEDLINEMCRYGASELHAVAALIGGIASQEVIKLITRQFVPLSGTFIFSGIDHKSLLLNL